MKIKRYNIFLPVKDIETLKTFPGHFSEHIRIAVRNYLERWTSSSISKSNAKSDKEQGGEK